MTCRYFDEELDYLRQQGRAYGSAHPATAGLLAEKCSNPDVEMLLQGVAFMGARLRQQIDHALPNLLQSLVRWSLPQALRPMPAVTLVEYSPPFDLRDLRRIPSGTRIDSKSLDGTSCPFQTTQAVDLLPLRLNGAEIVGDDSDTPMLRLQFGTSRPGYRLLPELGRLKLWIHGDAAVAGRLYEWLAGGYIADVHVASGPTEWRLSPNQLQPAGFGTEEHLLPWGSLLPTAFRHLYEYFAFRQKFRQIDLLGLDRLELRSEEFEVRIAFRRPPALHRTIDVSNFRLFCTPAVNLFECAAEPVNLSLRRTDYLLKAAGLDSAHAEVFDVLSVTGIRGGCERHTLRPLNVLDPASHVFTLRAERSPIDNRLDTYLQMADPNALMSDETLSVELLCTNRCLPAFLQPGDLNSANSGKNTPAPFRNISTVLPGAAPNLDPDFVWRACAVSSMHRWALQSAEALRALLRFYNPYGGGEECSANRVNVEEICSIHSVVSRASARVWRGAAILGAQIEIELDEATSEVIGDAYLFGSLLNRVIDSYASLSSFHELRLVACNRRRVWEWMPARFCGGEVRT